MNMESKVIDCFMFEIGNISKMCRYTTKYKGNFQCCNTFCRADGFRAISNNYMLTWHVKRRN